MARVSLDPNAKILKARALQGKGADAESVRLLEDHLASRGGSDESMLAALLLIYRQQDNLPGIVQTGAKLLATKPADRKLQFEHARDLYRAKQASRARTIALALARSPEAGAYLADLLSLWLTHEDRQTSLEDARSLAPAARGRPRVLYARFFLEAGLPAEAEALLAPQASLPVTTGNADAIAVLGQAKLAQGKGQAGLALLDEVLAFDATNIQALRGRADHHRANRQFRQALRDTSRLVAENPSSAQDRLRLASLYISVGNLERAETTYWAAFRDIPGDARLYATLRAFLQRTGRSGDVSSVDKQYAEQKRILRSKLISA
jgi:tetratricopeptide (TPR) repeat protein